LVFKKMGLRGKHVVQPEKKENPMPARILLVEDDVLVRLTAADFLRDLGYVVVEAGTAEEAWEYLLSGQHISLVFSDVRMPGAFDGLELARRTLVRFPNVLVFITSGHLASEDVESSIALISKPYDLNKVAARFAAALGEAPSQAEIDAANDRNNND
jgi:CheY-like chemotaxis protein